MPNATTIHPAAALADRLFAATDLIEMRPLRKRADGTSESKGRKWIRRGEIASHIPMFERLESEGFAIYFGVCPRTRDGGGSKNDVARLRAFWADIDNTTVEAVTTAIADAQLPNASIMVSSGHGVHAYWLLHEPIEVTPGNVADLEAVNRGLANRIGGDDCGDLPRIFRLPGFTNRKAPAKPRPVEIVFPHDVYAELNRYAAADFADLAIYETATSEISGDLPEIVEVSMASRIWWESELKRLMEACDDDRSKADYGIVCDMLERGLSDNEIWTHCHDKSKFADCVAQGRGADYFNRTLSKARESVEADKGFGTRPLPDSFRITASTDNAPPETPSAPPADKFAPFKISFIQNNPKSWEPARYVPTGIKAVDDALGGGFRMRGTHCAAGRTGRGKTTFMTWCAVRAAAAGIPTAFISLELDAPDVMRLATAQFGDIPRSFLERCDVRGIYSDRHTGAKHAMADWPLWILDADCWNGPMTRNCLAKIVREGVALHGWQFVVVDYLGLIANEPKDASQYVADIENSTMLKSIARTHDIALAVVASLRKSASFKPGAGKGKPSQVTMDDLLGAARFAYDAVSVLHIDSVKHEIKPGYQGERTGEIHVDVWKSRFSAGANGDSAIVLDWRPATGRIACNEVGDDTPF